MTLNATLVCTFFSNEAQEINNAQYLAIVFGEILLDVLCFTYPMDSTELSLSSFLQ